MENCSQAEKDVMAAYPPETIQEFMGVVMPLVEEASGIIKANLSSRDKKVTEKSNVTDLVTETDKAMERLLVEGIKAKFPDHKFIGEEDVAEKAQGQTVGEVTDDPTWIIDPIDGTMNFVHGHPMVSVSVGLVIKKVPWMGIISVPMTNSIYTAVRFKGAFLNGQQIQVSPVSKLDKAMVLQEVWSQSDFNGKQVANIAKILDASQAMRTVGSAAINLAMIANGEAEVYAQVGIRCWDIVAGGLIVKEAGGCLMDPRGGPEGGPYDYMSRGILATANPQLAKEVLDLNLEYHHVPRDHQDKFSA